MTKDGTSTGIPLVVLFKTDDWSPYRVNESEVAGGAEVQTYDVGDDSHTLNWPVEFEIPVCPDVVWAALFAQRNQLHAVVAGSFTFKATGSGGTERSQAFTSLRWISLSHDSAPDAVNRFAARMYRRVQARLISEA